MSDGQSGAVGEDLWWEGLLALSLEWKRVGVMDGESGGDGGDGAGRSRWVE